MKYLRVILIVLLLLNCTLWLASYWWIEWLSSNGVYSLQLKTGQITVARHDRLIGISNGLTIHGYSGQPTRWWPAVRIYTNLPKFFFVYQGTFWLPTLLLALPLAISATPWARRRRRAKQGLCIRCGYDLSGSESGVCSECGAQAG